MDFSKTYKTDSTDSRISNSGREREMKTHNLENTRHSINFRKLAKPAVLCISALFIISMLSVFASTGVQAATTPSLHTSGDQILDSNNNVVYLRGIGRTGDLQSASGMWSGPGMAVASWSQKWQSISSNIPLMDATLQSYQQYWHVNMIRVLIPVNWWWMDNVVPSQYQSGAPSTPISYRTYIETLVQEAAKYGIYVDFCPYDVFDGYTDSSGGNGNGIPGSLSTSAYNYMLSINSGGETQAWNTWWTSVVNNLGQYPNVIFEMWNEPDDGSNSATSAAATAYFNYAIQTYETIRSAGNTNLIFMQWHMGLIPTWTQLDWVPQLYNKLQSTIGSTPVNVAFTTHPYRYSPYPNTQWATTYTAVQAQLNAPNMVPATRSNGVNVPLVFNEMGVCQTVADNQELSYWDAILHNAQDMGIGVVAYYWMSDSDLGPVYFGESLVTGTWASGAQSPTPNVVGQTFLNYVPTTPSPTPTPTPTPTATPTPIPTATPTPTSYSHANFDGYSHPNTNPDSHASTNSNVNNGSNTARDAYPDPVRNTDARNNSTNSTPESNTNYFANATNKPWPNNYAATDTTTNLLPLLFPQTLLVHVQLVTLQHMVLLLPLNLEKFPFLFCKNQKIPTHKIHVSNFRFYYRT